MILVLALGVGVLFGAGVTLMLSRDLLRMAAGAVLLSNGVNLLLVASGRSPLTVRLNGTAAGVSADPLVQALTLTAIVITFGIAAVLLGLVIRVCDTHGTIDLDAIAEAEREEEERYEREREEV